MSTSNFSYAQPNRLILCKIHLISLSVATKTPQVISSNTPAEASLIPHSD
uniref:Uncharacterized protein n=1 Tax=Arundo donax TaxID=35708 RepID=A0A0A8YU72_ARUDO